MIKAIFLDIDNTLFSHKTKSIPSSSKEAIQLAQKRGIKIILATGRSLQELEEIDYEELTFDGYITNNGQICYNENKEVIYDEPIHKEDLNTILHYFNEHTFSILFINLKDSYVNFVNDQTIKAQSAVSLTCAPARLYQNEKIYQIVLYSTKEEADAFLKKMPHCKMTQWHDCAFDIISKSGSKSNGILNTLSYFHLEDEEYMTIGDAYNDIEMIELAPIGVAMGNACDALKEKADYITDSIDEDGLYNAFKKYLII